MASHAHPLDQSRPDDARPKPGTKRHCQRLPHLRRIHPMSHEQQIALIEEARAARLREHGHPLAKSEGENGGNRQK
jgi:hypothetical protein